MVGSTQNYHGWRWVQTHDYEQFTKEEQILQLVFHVCGDKPDDVAHANVHQGCSLAWQRRASASIWAPYQPLADHWVLRSDRTRTRIECSWVRNDGHFGHGDGWVCDSHSEHQSCQVLARGSWFASDTRSALCTLYLTRERLRRTAIHRLNQGSWDPRASTRCWGWRYRNQTWI